MSNPNSSCLQTNDLAAGGQPGVAQDHRSVDANQGVRGLASNPESIVHGIKLVSRDMMTQNDVRTGVG